MYPQCPVNKSVELVLSVLPALIYSDFHYLVQSLSYQCHHGHHVVIMMTSCGYHDDVMWSS